MRREQNADPLQPGDEPELPSRRHDPVEPDSMNQRLSRRCLALNRSLGSYRTRIRIGLSMKIDDPSAVPLIGQARSIR